MTPVDIREFIAARLDDDQRAAEKAASLCGCHSPRPVWLFDDSDGEGSTEGRILIANDPHPEPRRKLSRRWSTSYEGLFFAEHIVIHDPARVLRDVASGRKLLDLAEHLSGWSREHNSSLTDEQIKDARWAADQMLRAYAMRWADHPHYRTEWTP